MSLDRQAVFNKVYNHFIHGKGRPGWHDAEGRCIYGKPGDSARCAIGIFDETGVLSGKRFIVSDIDGDELLRVFPSFDPAAGDLGFLASLQQAHDTPLIHRCPPEELQAAWRYRFGDVAADYDLTIPEAPTAG